MEVLSALIRLVNAWSLLTPLHPWLIQHSASLYADGLVVFLSPKEQDFLITRLIFDSFSGASGLACNITKMQMLAIRCDD
jgi:hypothetical protein